MPDSHITLQPDSIAPDTSGQTGARAGLTVVGTGLQALGHLTREAIGHIRHADIVFYGISDPLVVADVLALNANAVDLTVLYGDSKHRRTTYEQMAQAMVREVRAGRRVTAVFYGHPGFYVAPARLAMSILDKEGYPNRMLPGISSLDYLFADLKVDPSQRGLQTLEATDFLLRDRPLMTTGHVVLMQVGPVGDLFRPTTDNLTRRALLFSRLIEIYGPDHPCVHYIGAPRPGEAPTMTRLPLSAYRDAKVLARLRKSSTLYIPPKDRAATNAAMAAALGIEESAPAQSTAPGTTADADAGTPPALIATAAAAVSQAFLDAMAAVTQDPAAAAQFHLDPLRFVQGFGAPLEGEIDWLRALRAVGGKPAPKAVSASEEVYEEPGRKDEEVYETPGKKDEEVYEIPSEEEVYETPGKKDEEVYETPSEEEVYETPGKKDEEVYETPSEEEVYETPGKKDEEVYETPSEEEVYETPDKKDEEVYETPSKGDDKP